MAEWLQQLILADILHILSKMKNIIHKKIPRGPSEVRLPCVSPQAAGACSEKGLSLLPLSDLSTASFPQACVRTPTRAKGRRFLWGGGTHG